MAASLAPGVSDEAQRTAAFRGVAGWIDIYDAGPWRRPERTVARLARRGVRTLYIQTSNYRRPRALQRRRALPRLLAAADGHGIGTVAWYLPGFADVDRDWRRVQAAVRYTSPDGHRFDGFALDIEATAVRDVGVRNRRLLLLSDRLRRLAGPAYPLGAIIPDPVSQRYWPRFPYAQVRGRYDAILPMAYWTAETRGAERVRRRTCRALRIIRERTRDPAVPIHVIGGIADAASAAEVRGFALGAKACGAAGASLYDAPLVRPAQWEQLTRLDPLRQSARPVRTA
jgi:hypothetical protein